MSLNLLSVDVEDWYTSAYLRDYISTQDCSPRIVESTLPILDLFNSNKVKATFFVLGTIAEKQPELIRRIASYGHEIASHGYGHTPLRNLTPREFKKEIRLTNQILETITGKKVLGFRAPYASLFCIPFFSSKYIVSTMISLYLRFALILTRQTR